MLNEEPHAGLLVEGRIRLVRKIGAGSYGVVWLAKDESNFDREVAFKVLNPMRREQVRARQRFAREMKVLRELGHPNIPELITFDSEGQYPFVVMELVVGTSLLLELKRRSMEGNAFKNHEVAAIAQGLFAALEHAHRAQIVHRDVKPDNIIVQSIEGKMITKVLDFGIAHLVASDPSDQTTLGRILGSPGYMSPEQCIGEEIDARADVFSAAVVLFETLTMRRTWMLDGTKSLCRFHQPSPPKPELRAEIVDRIRFGPRPRVSEFNAALPPAFDRLIEKALSVSVEARHHSISELSADLRAAYLEIGVQPESELETQTRVLSDTQLVERGEATAIDNITKTVPLKRRVYPSRRAGLTVVLTSIACVGTLLIVVIPWNDRPSTPIEVPVEVAPPSEKPTVHAVATAIERGLPPEEVEEPSLPTAPAKKVVRPRSVPPSALPGEEGAEPDLTNLRKLYLDLEREPQNDALRERLEQQIRQSASSLEDAVARKEVLRLLITSRITRRVEQLGAAIDVLERRNAAQKR